MNYVARWLLIVALLSTTACKKEKAQPAAPAPAAEATPPAEPAKPAGPTIPDVPLDGTAAENLVAVFEAGVNALRKAPDAATGAAILNGMLQKYDVAELRAKSKAAKEAGHGAAPELKNKLSELQNEYQEVSTRLGATDPAAFGEAAKAWAAAWGLN